MKTSMKLILGLLLTAPSLQGFAQKPEPVYSFIRQTHDFDWYEQQAKAWKQEIDRGTKDKMAWVYFFKANRYAKFTDEKKWESKAGSYFITQDKIIKLAEKAIPKTFECYFLKSNDDEAGNGVGESNIMKAQALRPYDPLILPWLMNYYQFKNDKTNIEIVSKKWLESNEMPQEILTTAYNNLVSLEPNAILLTNGDNDTYPYWVLQNARKLRTDVTVLNISLGLINPYRERLFGESGIPQLVMKNDSCRRSEFLVTHVIENVHDKPIYVGVFTDQDYYKSYADNMYLIGLSYKYSKKAFDNIAVLRNNVENKFMLDFLRNSFYNNYAQSAVNQMNTGYLALFLKLYEHYEACGETQKAERLKEIAKKVAENGGSEDWMKYFEK